MKVDGSDTAVCLGDIPAYTVFRRAGHEYVRVPSSSAVFKDGFRGSESRILALGNSGVVWMLESTEVEPIGTLVFEGDNDD